MDKPIRVALLGAGGRGTMFASLLKNYVPDAKLVAVAEPREAYRKAIAKEHQLSEKETYQTWQACAKAEIDCNAVIVATMDQEHVEPAVTFLKRGCHLFLEKPMATTLEDCQAIAAAQKDSGAITAVCHSMRYHKGFRKLKELVTSGRIGRVITMNQLEQVGYWHQAHSFVRGNWGNEARSTFMLMAKSCHDLDYICHLVDLPCERVSSFGSLAHFTKADAPEGATERCTDGCPVEADCPYSALKQYVYTDRETWPANVVSFEHTVEAHLEALRSGPYGRCVYKVDNDVVDHQVCAIEFAGGVTATFTMTAFTQGGGRILTLHGSEGELRFEEHKIVIRDFGSNNVETILIRPEQGGHGGGDCRVITSWMRAIREQDPSHILTDVHESLKTHSVVFAAEQSRREGRTVETGG